MAFETHNQKVAAAIASKKMQPAGLAGPAAKSLLNLGQAESTTAPSAQPPSFTSAAKAKKGGFKL